MNRHSSEFSFFLSISQAILILGNMNWVRVKCRTFVLSVDSTVYESREGLLRDVGRLVWNGWDIHHFSSSVETSTEKFAVRTIEQPYFGIFKDDL